jgi:predicted anti-sigma-YlaC factor YlaD
MRCVDARELISARLDAELTALEEEGLDVHLLGCAGCADHARHLAVLHRLRIRPAEQVPDLTAKIVARTTAPRTRELLPVLDLANATLLVVALTQLVFALPVLLLGDTPAGAVHTGRELAAFNAAFAVGLLVVVWQPGRASGLLPMAAALAGAMLLGGAADQARGVEALVDEGHHLLEVVGLGGLYVVARRSHGRPDRLAPA